MECIIKKLNYISNKIASYESDFSYTSITDKEQRQLEKLYKKYYNRDENEFFDKAFEIAGEYFKDPDDAIDALEGWVLERPFRMKNKKFFKWLR